MFLENVNCENNIVTKKYSNSQKQRQINLSQNNNLIVVRKCRQHDLYINIGRNNQIKENVFSSINSRPRREAILKIFKIYILKLSSIELETSIRRAETAILKIFKKYKHFLSRDTFDNQIIGSDFNCRLDPLWVTPKKKEIKKVKPTEKVKRFLHKFSKIIFLLFILTFSFKLHANISFNGICGSYDYKLDISSNRYYGGQCVDGRIMVYHDISTDRIRYIYADPLTSNWIDLYDHNNRVTASFNSTQNNGYVRYVGENANLTYVLAGSFIGFTILFFSSFIFIEVAKK